MKQLTCAQMGGPSTCTAVISGNTVEETVANGMKHLEAAHPDMAAKAKAMTPEENEKWMEGFKKQWDALPEM